MLVGEAYILAPPEKKITEAMASHPKGLTLRTKCLLRLGPYTISYYVSYMLYGPETLLRAI